MKIRPRRKLAGLSKLQMFISKNQFRAARPSPAKRHQPRVDGGPAAVIHGDEPEGTLCCHMVDAVLNPKKMRGSVVLVPVLPPLSTSKLPYDAEFDLK